MQEENETQGKEKMGEKKENEEHEKVIGSNKYISRAKRVENGTVPLDILEFHHSFSYDCQKYFNLCVAERNILIFISGNLLHFFNTTTNELWFRRGYTNEGIGHVTKNPRFDHIAVGENGIKPPIIIYEWPSMYIVTILYNGTLKSYSHLTYSADGLFLVSQGGEPDYTITLWDWQKSRVVLKCRSYNRNVYNVMMSPLLPGYLVTSGSEHIKFWNISKTVTGLKLKGEIGRFGQTEISDIIGIYIMPDGKVISSCEWGNILLWEEGLITLEICQKNRQPCHTKAITQFEYINGELISVGMDGWIRSWFYETIDQANFRDDEHFLEIQPIYEYHISENSKVGNSMLMCIRKQEADNPESTFWYAQDGSGGIWLIDLRSMNAELPQKIFTCHEGAIVDMDNATWGPFIATLGKAGQLHVYNYLEKKLILEHKFNDTGSQIVWFPCHVEATGSTLACAFQSGIVRIITVAISTANFVNNIKGDYVRLIQVMKPHKTAIMAMSSNPSYSLLVTGGEDSTIFSFAITMTETYPVIVPIGFITVPSGVTCLTWKPQYETTLLIGCLQGECVEVTLPNMPRPYTISSYELVECQLKAFKFNSVKSIIRRELIRLNRKRERKEKEAKRRDELMQLVADASEMEIDEESPFDVEEDEEPLPQIYVPEIPNKVLIAQYINHNIIWLSMAGFDAGYMYEYPSPEMTEIIGTEPVRSIIIYDADDTEIRSCLFYISQKKKYLFLGMEHGQIRVCRWKPENYADLSDYWILPMHDNYNGYIPKMLLSHDQKMLFTCGYDGNLFSYTIKDYIPTTATEYEIIRKTFTLPRINVDDIEIDHATLEETIQQVERDKIAWTAKQSKYRTLEMLSQLNEEYNKIIERNNALPKFHQITHDELELDLRIMTDLNKELEMEMTAVREKLAFKMERSELALQKLLEHFIHPITCLPFTICKISQPDDIVYSLRQYILDTDVTLPHNSIENYVCITDDRTIRNRIREKEWRGLEEEGMKEKLKMTRAKEQPIANFSESINYKNADSNLGIQLKQMLRKYTLRKMKLEEREKKWKVIHSEKPDTSINHKHDVLIMEESEKTIGDYKLKTLSTFNLLEERDISFSKYKELLNCWKKLYYLQEAFNAKLKTVRTKKEYLHTKVLRLRKDLKNIHVEIPLQSTKCLPTIPTSNINIEYPEKKVMIQKYTLKVDRAKTTQRRRLSIPEQIAICSDKEYEVLLLDEEFLKHIQISNEQPLILFSITERELNIQSIAQDNIVLFHLSHVDSPWNREIKTSRMLRKIYEQDCILKYTENSYENINKTLDELKHNRLDIVAESIYINLFLSTIRQEYIILREYELIENVLHENVNRKLEEIVIIKQKIQITSDKVNAKTEEISKLHNQIRDICFEYMNSISDNKFRNFLCRIFKKKYKELKREDDSITSTVETSSDASNSPNDESDTFHLDENVCPPGCSKQLYDLTFLMREKRYAYEHRIKDVQQTVEILSKEIEIQTKKLKVVESILNKNENDLKIFMLKKQRKLNNVDTTVIMRLHQLQYFEECEVLSRMHDCIVFDKEKLSKLYIRVQELHEETLELHAKHKHARIHLHRITLDCDHMRTINKNLRNEIKLKIMNKFGQRISLNKLYETILRQIVYNVKTNLNKTTIYFTKRMKDVKESYTEGLSTFSKLIQEHTQKLSFVTLLIEEESKLQKLKQHVPANKSQLEENYKSDIRKLKKIFENQMQQKYLYQNNMKNLTLKIKS